MLHIAWRSTAPLLSVDELTVTVVVVFTVTPKFHARNIGLEASTDFSCPFWDALNHRCVHEARDKSCK